MLLHAAIHVFLVPVVFCGRTKEEYFRIPREQSISLSAGSTHKRILMCWIQLRCNKPHVMNRQPGSGAS